MSADHTACWYCEAVLSPRHEHDHVRPRRHDGTVTVPACMNCHDLKDRVPLAKWPAAAGALRAIVDLAASPAAGIFMAARAAVCAVELGGPAPQLDWSEPDAILAIEQAPAGLPRVLLSKMYALGMDAATPAADRWKDNAMRGAL